MQTDGWKCKINWLFVFCLVGQIIGRFDEAAQRIYPQATIYTGAHRHRDPIIGENHNNKQVRPQHFCSQRCLIDEQAYTLSVTNFLAVTGLRLWSFVPWASLRSCWPTMAYNNENNVCIKIWDGSERANAGHRIAIVSSGNCSLKALLKSTKLLLPRHCDVVLIMLPYVR